MRVKAVVVCTKEIEMDIDDSLLTEEYFKEFSSWLWKMKDKEEMIRFAARLAFDEPENMQEGVGVMKSSWNLKRKEEVSVAYRVTDDEISVESWEPLEGKADGKD